MATVAFDGANKKITITLSGASTTVTSAEIYSKWKAWVAAGNEQWLPAFANSVGGDSIGAGTTLGQYFFLNNSTGWRICATGAPGGDKTLIVNGNLYGVDPDIPIINNSGYAANVTVLFERSSLATGVATGGGGGTTITSQEIADAVWNEPMTHIEPNTFGRRVRELFPLHWGIK